MNEAPCINCERRRFDCHSYCPEYTDWKAGRNAMAEERAKKTAARPELPRRVVVQIWRGMIRGVRRR